MLVTDRVDNQFKFSDTGCSCLGTVYYNGKATVMVIDSVMVDEMYRGMGIGTNLMKHVIAFAKNLGVDAIELVVDRDNKVAKKLYKTVGFQKTNNEHHRIILKEF